MTFEKGTDVIDETGNKSTGKSSMEQQTGFSLSTIIEFTLCFAGLQVSYLIWGIMQESIMGSTYDPTPLNPSGKFPSATFCVFSNRFLAIIVAAIVCKFQHGTLQSSAPLWYFTPCALSNTLSSWGQYQALSFVSFSLQTLFKATKVIPVMIMGRLLKGTNYSVVEYLEAILITGGVAVFSMSSNSPYTETDNGHEIKGFMLLVVYVLSDSFTAQWQSRIYRDYGKIDTYHMMYGVNCSSIILTALALVFSGDIPKVIEFCMYNPLALWYNVITAITSTTGQMAIFYTIKRFGPVVFTIIMTTRQMLSIVLSTIVFGHSISAGSVLGALFVFTAIFHSVYRQVKEKKEKKTPPQSGDISDDLKKPSQSSDEEPLLQEARNNDKI